MDGWWWAQKDLRDVPYYYVLLCVTEQNEYNLILHLLLNNVPSLWKQQVLGTSVC